jgi:hypothetical protein
MKTVHEVAETFALNQWLSDYPTDMSYEQIIDSLDSDAYIESDDIAVWQPIEDYSGHKIAEIIEDTREAFIRHVTGILNEVTA